MGEANVVLRVRSVRRRRRRRRVIVIVRRRGGRRSRRLERLVRARVLVAVLNGLPVGLNVGIDGGKGTLESLNLHAALGNGLERASHRGR